MTASVPASIRLMVDLPSLYSELGHDRRAVVRREFMTRAFQNRPELEVLFAGWRSVSLPTDPDGNVSEATLTACLTPKLALYNELRRMADPNAFQPELGSEAHSAVRYEYIGGDLICFHDRFLMQPSQGLPAPERWKIHVTTGGADVTVRFSMGVQWRGAAPAQP